MKNLLLIIILLCVGYGQSAHLEIQNVNLTEGTLDVYMTNDVPVTGFQFQLAYDCEINNTPSNCNDECCYLTVLSATGGEIVPDDWLTWGTGDWNNIMGFSMDPNLMIPAGEGVLVTVSFTDYSGEEICIPVVDYPGDQDFPLISGEIPEGEWSPIVIPCTVGDCIVCDVVDDCGVCGGDNSSCSGCTDPNASNYDENATIDDGTCEYDEVYGCTYSEATNYNPDATDDDGSCEYLWGDINHDGELNMLDLVTIVNAILSGDWF